MVTGAYTTTETVVVSTVNNATKALTFRKNQSGYSTGYSNFVPGTVVVSLGQGFHDDGAGYLVYNGAGATSGTIDYATGSVTLNVFATMATTWDGKKFTVSANVYKATKTELRTGEREIPTLTPVTYFDGTTTQVSQTQKNATTSLTFHRHQVTYVTGHNNFVPGTVAVSLGQGFSDDGNGRLVYNGVGTAGGTIDYATGSVTLNVSAAMAASRDGLTFQITGIYVTYKTVDPTAPLVYYDGSQIKREEVRSKVLFSVYTLGTSNVNMGISDVVPGSVSISLGSGLVDSGTGLLKTSGSGAVCGYIDYARGTITWNLPPTLAEEWKTSLYTISGQRTLTTYTVVPKKGSPYKISFHANGGKGKMAKTSAKYGKKVKLPSCNFTRDGYVFAGWALKKGWGAFLADKATVKNLSCKGGTVTLYAQWAKESYKVKFYANGGKGKMAVQKFTYGKAAKLKANTFKRKGYTFKGWAKSKALANQGKVAYKNKKAVKNLVTTGKTVKLYAVWKKK